VGLRSPAVRHGLALSRYAGTVRGMATADVLFSLGMALLIAGAVMQIIGQRVGRISG
jgi:hypothetical protein